MTDLATLPDLMPERAALLDAAVSAGAEIMKVYAQAFSTEVKSDGSPVTEADERAEKVILAALGRHFPSIPVVAEEAVEAGHLPDVGNRYFLVDPLDGTKEFVSRNGEFTVNIALIENGFPVFGVVYAPALGDIYWGGRLPEDDSSASAGSASAFKANVKNGEIRDARAIAVRNIPEQGISVLASRSHLSEETSAFIERFKVAECVSVGSSLKLCVVAEGRADLYPRLAPTMQWDIAAGDAVLRAAGGDVFHASDLAPLSYRVPKGAVKEDLLNPYFLALGTRELLDLGGLAGSASQTA